MPKKLSKKQKEMLRDNLDMARTGIEKHALNMIQILDNAGDQSNCLKLKQALLSFRVVYNRARLKLDP